MTAASPTYSIAVLVGSLRAESYNRKMAHALIDLAPDNLALSLVAIDDLPHYNPDLENEDRPAPWKTFRQAIAGADGLLFLTPEYNRSVPGVLKNALDVGSRPYGQSVWDGKPGAIISMTPGKLGAFGANHHLRQSMVFLNVPVMAQPEAYIGGAGDLFNDDGDLATDSIKDFMSTFVDAFANWVDTVAGD